MDYVSLSMLGTKHSGGSKGEVRCRGNRPVCSWCFRLGDLYWVLFVGAGELLGASPGMRVEGWFQAFAGFY